MPDVLLPRLSDAMEQGTVVRWLKRSEEHTSELQSRQYLVCRFLLEKTTLIVDPRLQRARRPSPAAILGAALPYYVPPQPLPAVHGIVLRSRADLTPRTGPCSCALLR